VTTTPETTFARIRKLIEEHMVTGEGGWAVSITAMRQADDELLAYRGGPHEFEAEMLRGEIAMGLKDYRTAADRFVAILATNPADKNQVRYRLAFAHRKAGNMYEAQTVLQSIGPRYSTKQRVVNEHERLDQDFDAASALHLGTQAFRRVEGGAFEEARTLMAAVAVLQGLSPSDRANMVAAMGDVIAYAEHGARPVEVAAPPEFNGRAILCCGFGWSGSGAVADYLRRADGIRYPFGDTEVSMFEGNGGAAYGAIHILNALPLEAEALRLFVSQFMMMTVLGLGFPRGKRVDAMRWRQKSLAKHFQGRTEALPAITRTLLSALDRADAGQGIESAKVVEAFRAMVAQVIRALAPEGETVLLNNCVHAYSLQLVPLFTDPVAFAVFRDPRDQYAARVIENPRRVISLERFIERYDEDLASFSSAMANPAVAANVRRLRFEEFVLSAKYRAEVVAMAGLPPRDLEGIKSNFDPAQSIHNVGLHKRFANQADIRALEEKYPDYIFEG